MQRQLRVRYGGLINFGVAKATGGTFTEQTLNTGFGALVGTPQHMSPEQLTFNNLDIATRSATLVN